MAWPGQAQISFTLPNSTWSAGLPLMEIGATGTAEVLGLRYIDSGHYAALYESWGVGMWASDPIAISPDRFDTLRIQAGPLLGIPPSSPLAILSKAVVIWKRDTPILWHTTDHAYVGQPTIHFMNNAVGSSTMREDFAGRLDSIRTVDFNASWKAGPISALDLQVGSRGVGNEPLVGTGTSGMADLLSIVWLADGKACLLYDHWGLAFQKSSPFDWSETAVHRLRVELPSLVALDSGQAGELGKGKLKVTVDGSVVWEKTVPYFAAASATVVVGRNLAGNSSAAPTLTAAVIAVTQVSNSAPVLK